MTSGYAFRFIVQFDIDHFSRCALHLAVGVVFPS